MITEPDVTLTDHGLALEPAVFKWFVRRRSDPARPLGPRLALFCGATSIYHLIQGVALVMALASSREFVGRQPC